MSKDSAFDGRAPPNEKPVNLPFDDWKEALREFFRREDEDVRPERESDREGVDADG